VHNGDEFTNDLHDSPQLHYPFVPEGVSPISNCSRHHNKTDVEANKVAKVNAIADTISAVNSRVASRARSVTE
jgi:hypothetical protein